MTGTSRGSPKSPSPTSDGGNQDHDDHERHPGNHEPDNETSVERLSEDQDASDAEQEQKDENSQPNGASTVS